MYNENTLQTYLGAYSKNKNYLFLFILWPFLAFLMALANYREKESKWVVYLFLIYYGFTFVGTNIYADSYRYIISLHHNATLPFSEFFRVVGGLYSETTVDVMEPLISFVVSRFTSYHGVYFAIWTLIYGFFYLKSINLLYDKYLDNRGWNTLIPMIFFVLILPITYVSSVRMWTAAWMFFYAAYHIIIYRKPKYFIIALGASFVHWSFFIACAVLLIYYVLGNRNYIYLALVIVSFLLPRLILPLLGNISARLGGAFLLRYEGYSSEGFILSQNELLEESSWFLQVGVNLLFYFMLLAIIWIQISTAGKEKERPEKNLYSFLLLFLAFVNFGMPIPSFGGRFIVVFFLFATLYIFNYFSQIQTTRINFLTLLGLVPMGIYVATVFRISSESINPWIFTPIFGSPWLAPVISVADLLFH